MRVSLSFAIASILLSGTPAAVAAQALGVGPRLALVRGDVDAGTGTQRFTGGVLRARVSPRTALELSIDYRSETNEALTERIRDYPVQGSLLLYLVRSGVSPYLLGGVGWYSQRVETLNDRRVETASGTRTFGYHAGLGGEIRAGRRAAIHMDYRYTFIHFGAGDETGTTGPTAGAGSATGFSVPGLSFVADRLRLSHEGSMWTGGVTIYF
jgi:hypothetical protein